MTAFVYKGMLYKVNDLNLAELKAANVKPS